MKTFIPFTTFILITIFYLLYRKCYLNKSIEHFNIPSPSPTPTPTPTLIYSKPSYTKKKTIDNQYLKLEFIYLNPLYKDLTIKLKDGILVKEENDWKGKLEKELCTPDNINTNTPSASIDSCTCLNLGINNEKICGKEYSRYIYECPNKCSSCNKCHTDKTHKSYIECKNIENKKKCKSYKDKLIFSKEYYTSNDRKFIEMPFSPEESPSPSPSPEVPRGFKKKNNGKTYKKIVIRSNQAKNIFKTTLINDFITDNDILLKISKQQNYNKEESPSPSPEIEGFSNNASIKKIVIQNLYFNMKTIEYDIFYEGKDEIYLFIVPKKRHVGKNITLTIKGYYKLDKNYGFELEKIINIYEYIEKAVDIKEIKQINEYESSLANDYVNNYLGDSELESHHLMRNPRIINDIKNKPLGEFERKEILDSPETWVERIDINRPWISTFTEVFSDIYAEYNQNKDNYSPSPSGTIDEDFDFFAELQKPNANRELLYKKKLQQDKIRFKKQRKEEIEYDKKMRDLIKRKRTERWDKLLIKKDIDTKNKYKIIKVLNQIREFESNIVILGKDNNYNDKKNIIEILKKKKINIRDNLNVNAKTTILIIDDKYYDSISKNIKNIQDKSGDHEDLEKLRTNFKKALINKLEIVTYTDFLNDLGKNIAIYGANNENKKFILNLINKTGRNISTEINKNTLFVISPGGDINTDISLTPKPSPSPTMTNKISQMSYKDFFKADKEKYLNYITFIDNNIEQINNFFENKVNDEINKDTLLVISNNGNIRLSEKQKKKIQQMKNQDFIDNFI